MLRRLELTYPHRWESDLPSRQNCADTFEWSDLIHLTLISLVAGRYVHLEREIRNKLPAEEHTYDQVGFDFRASEMEIDRGGGSLTIYLTDSSTKYYRKWFRSSSNITKLNVVCFTDMILLYLCLAVDSSHTVGMDLNYILCSCPRRAISLEPGAVSQYFPSANWDPWLLYGLADSANQ
jgi:hypothetical protein